ncbi:MAG TPA: hypothetical protein PL131_11260 [Methylotenera sp.]|nr:hypothetical protein [Methylotenera sp.]HPH06445.1 hypothetical protein [Methylotenera sp.]HPN00408.1 hypothetical protein [Methylotenera sp.]
MIKHQSTLCKCNIPPFHYADYDSVDFDTGNSIAEISLQNCKHCGNIWLKYLIEDPSRSGSGRWWRVLVPASQVASITADNAKAFIENQTEGIVGGSYFGSTGMKISGRKIEIR